MRVLYLGGTGEVSYGGIEASLQLGHEVFVFNRGTSGVPLPAGAHGIRGDINDSASYAALGLESWDAVCQFRAFTPDDVRRDVETFAGATSQLSHYVRQKPGLGSPIRGDGCRPERDSSRGRGTCYTIDSLHVPAVTVTPQPSIVLPAPWNHVLVEDTPPVSPYANSR